jgi:hypothetical protein
MSLNIPCCVISHANFGKKCVFPATSKHCLNSWSIYALLLKLNVIKVLKNLTAIPTASEGNSKNIEHSYSLNYDPNFG